MNFFTSHLLMSNIFERSIIAIFYQILVYLSQNIIFLREKYYDFWLIFKFYIENRVAKISFKFFFFEKLCQFIESQPSNHLITILFASECFSDCRKNMLHNIQMIIKLFIYIDDRINIFCKLMLSSLIFYRVVFTKYLIYDRYVFCSVFS